MVRVSHWLMGPLKTTELANQENARLKQKGRTTLSTVDRRPVALKKNSSQTCFSGSRKEWASSTRLTVARELSRDSIQQQFIT
jgi:hypothetical protein